MTRDTQRRVRASLRLSEDVRPTRVSLAIEVDPGRSARFRGDVSIQVRVMRPVRKIELHAVDLRVSKPRIEIGGKLRRAKITARPERDSIELHCDSGVPEGEATLRMSFSGRLGQDLRGLYAAAAGERRYAVTQLEATEARRFFPCFDEPAMKARFRISVTTAAANTVLSNAPIQGVDPLPASRKTVHFRETPPLSTYLIALAVGEFVSSEPTHAGETEIRVWHVPGKETLCEFALEAARETLLRLERYFALPYPYAKLDLVAVPDFEAGAMENAGAVFFRETLLLVDPATITLQEKKRVAEVICHELAHMWYGDLVTMAWWDDLWLNEAFATWMAFQIVDRWKPEWKMWHDFQHHRAAALDLDALANTHPIYVDVRSPAEATANFDLITYEKGASVVRMIERYLGASAFRKGVRRYIRRHREGNAVAADLWSALSEASGNDVEPVVRAWIEQSGFPLVSLRRVRDGRRSVLELHQRRFRASPSASRSERSSRWPIPWVGRVGEKRGTRTERRLLTRARERIDLGSATPRFVYGNADEGGFFRPLHSAQELIALAAGRRALSPVERMGLLGHQWAAVRSGQAVIESFLQLVDAFANERDPDVLAFLHRPLAFIREQLVPIAGPEAPGRLRDWLVGCFGPELRRLGWDPAPEEADATRLRRATLVGILGNIAEWEPVLETATLRFDAYLEDRSSLDSNLADPVVGLAARRADRERYGTLRKAAKEAASPQERRRFLLALGAVRDPALVARTLRLTLTPEVHTQDVAILLAGLLANREAREASWTFVQAHWDRLARRMPAMLVTRLIEATPALQTAGHRREVARFFREHPIPTAERALRQALERFRLNAAVRRRAGPGLRRWLAEQSCG